MVFNKINYNNYVQKIIGNGYFLLLRICNLATKKQNVRGRFYGVVVLAGAWDDCIPFWMPTQDTATAFLMNVPAFQM